MQQPDMGTPAVLNLRDLHQRKEPRKNPRTRFKQEPMDKLVANIKAKGVLQPILVRPRPEGGYEIVAGERRVRASRVAFGEDGTIPAYIRECTEDEADEYALLENTEREPMSPAEEAEAAHAILVREAGNHEAAAAALGWSVSMLKRRVALMRLTPEARAALVNEQIEIGHAELLAAVDPTKQNGALAKIIEHKLTIAQVRDQVAAMSHELSAAIFDRAECGGCDYNSSQQRALFGETVAEGRCTRPACYSAKTEERLQSIAAGLVEEVPKVVILRADSGIIPIKLAADGPVGVGAEQIKSCRSCANFGCTVSATLGSLGEVERDLCFDAECNTKLVAANIASRQPAPTSKSPAAAQGGKKKAGSAGAGSKGSSGKSSSTPASARPPRTDTTVKVPQAVKEYRVAQWRQIGARVAFAQPDAALRLLVALGLSGLTRTIDRAKTADALAQLCGAQKSKSYTRVLEAAMAVKDTPADTLVRVTHAMAASALKEVDEHNLRDALTYLAVDMGAHWKLGEDFLKLLTKSEIEALAEELGIAQAMGEKSFKKAMTGKKDEVIKAVLGVEGFQYAGAVPTVMRYDDPATVEFAASVGGSEAEDEDMDDEARDTTEVAEAAA